MKTLLLRKWSERVGVSFLSRGQAQVAMIRGGLGHRQPVGVARVRDIPDCISSWVFVEMVLKIITVHEEERAGWLFLWSGRHGREQ